MATARLTRVLSAARPLRLQRNLATGWPLGSTATEAPKPRLVRLASETNLFAEADAASEVLAELPKGEFLEAEAEESKGEGGDDSTAREWLLVRSPLENNIDSMSDKPLEYRTGWLHSPNLEQLELQLGDKVTARVNVASSHPVVSVLGMLPPWREKGLPSWISAAVAELYPGKIGGVIQQGRFLVQRPSGAMPERLATLPELLVTPRARARETARAGLVGLVLSGLLGVGVHSWAWTRGENFSAGRMAWPQLVGWFSIAACFLTPVATLPCYGFANTQASTACVVTCINLLFYNDLFGE